MHPFVIVLTAFSIQTFWMLKNLFFRWFLVAIFLFFTVHRILMSVWNSERPCGLTNQSAYCLSTSFKLTNQLTSSRNITMKEDMHRLTASVPSRCIPDLLVPFHSFWSADLCGGCHGDVSPNVFPFIIFKDNMSLGRSVPDRCVRILDRKQGVDNRNSYSQKLWFLWVACALHASHPGETQASLTSHDKWSSSSSIYDLRPVRTVST